MTGPGNGGYPAAPALASIAATLRWTAIGGLVLLGVWLISDVCLLVFAAALIGAVLRRAADRAGALLHLRPGWSLALILIIFGLLIATLVWWRGSATLDEMTRLWGQLDNQGRKIQGVVEQSQWARGAVGRLGSYLSDSGGAIAGTIAGAATTTLGGLGSLLLVAVTAVYFAASPALYRDGAVRMLPLRTRGRGQQVLQAVGDALVWWFAGQAVDMVVVAGLSWAGLAVLGVPLAPTLGLIAGLCNFVPFIGALAGAVPAVLVALGQGPGQALWVAGLFLAIQTVEGNVIAPLIQKRTVDLPPALTILSQTVLGTLFGPMGLILATPVTAASLVAVRMIYVEDVLESAGHPDLAAPSGTSET